MPENTGKKYIDGRGKKYRVMYGISTYEPGFKARYQMPNRSGTGGWKGVRQLPWRRTFEEAQADLDRMAAERGWRVWDGDSI